MSKEKEHCDHEGVCRFYPSYQEEMKQSCSHGNGCNYDTRSRPAPSYDSAINPTESDARGYRCLHCEARNERMFCHYHNTNIISLPEHDAEIRNSLLNNIFPKPTPEDKKSGWRYNYRFIEKIANRTEELSEDSACMETVMVVLKALEESLRKGEQP